MENDKKKIFLIAIAAILVILLVVFIIFIKKSNDDEKKYDKENNYTLVYEYKSETKLEQELKFVYRDKKLKSITLILYYGEDDIADIIAEEYKSTGEYKEVKNTENTVTLTYKEPAVKEYSSFNKDELTSLMETQGYKLKK